VDRRENGRCTGCVSENRLYAGKNGARGTPNLDAIRRREWRPGPELAAYLVAPTKVVLMRDGETAKRDGGAAEAVVVPKEPLEIAPCRGCGKVRLKPVGQLCGHPGTCEPQGRLF
jgi:hypothetical protein